MPGIGGDTPVSITASSTGLEVRSGGSVTVKSGGVLKIEAGGSLDVGTATGLLALAAGSITGAMLDTGAVTSGKIAAGAVDSTGLAAGAVTSGKLGAAAVDSSALSANLIAGFIPLSILSARKDGTSSGPGIIVSTASVPKLTNLGTASGKEISVLTWAAGGSSGASAKVGWSVPVPDDFDSATGWSVHFYGEKTSGNEVPVLTAHVRVGTATAEKGGAASGVFTSSPSDMSFNVASAVVLGPGVLNISAEINTNTSAAVRLQSGWVKYRRKS